MPDTLWWIQVAGAFFYLLLGVGGVTAALYATWRDTPAFINRLTGYARLEEKIDQLLRDHTIAQELMYQQAEEFNDLSRVVAEEHGLGRRQRPYVNKDTIREELLDEDRVDFTRGDHDD